MKLEIKALSPDELRLIERAAQVCGYKREESGEFARKLLLRCVASIVREEMRLKA